MNLILVNRATVWSPSRPSCAMTTLPRSSRPSGPKAQRHRLYQTYCECELEAQKDYCRMFRIKLPERRKDAPER